MTVKCYPPLLIFWRRSGKAKQALNQLLLVARESEGTSLTFFYCLTDNVIEGSLKP
jgi:hypothetical protein